MDRNRFKCAEFREMPDAEFNDFTKFYEDIVLNKMGICPTEECLVGMWSMYLYCKKHMITNACAEVDAILYEYGCTSFDRHRNVKRVSDAMEI